MNVQDFPLREVSAGDKEAVARILFHKANHQVDFAAGIQQWIKNRVIWFCPAGNHWYDILQSVACQGKFRKDEQIHAGLTGLFGQSQMSFQVSLNIPKPGIDLSEAKF